MSSLCCGVGSGGSMAEDETRKASEIGWLTTDYAD
jgi:hypothetical protein